MNKTDYNRRIHYSIIVSLVILILLFYFIPESENSPPSNTHYMQQPFTLIEVPVTRQRARPPKPAKPVIPVASEDPQILEDVNLEKKIKLNTDYSAQQNNEITESGQNDSFLPNQVLEVLPNNTIGCSGEIILDVKISTLGKMSAYKVISNTTNSADCLKSVTNALRKSVWESAEYAGIKKEVWIRKRYVFN